MKKILIFSFIILSFSMFNVSRWMVQSKLIESLVFPFDNEDYYSEIYIDYMPKNLNVNSTLNEIADKSKTNFYIQKANNKSDDGLGEYYWKIVDGKYLDNLSNLSEPISLKTFNKLETYIGSNDDSVEYSLDFIDGIYDFRYRLYPFSSYDGEVQYLSISSTSKNGMDEFKSLLKENNIQFFEIEQFRPVYTNFTYFVKAITYYPITLIASALSIIVIYLTLYRERRNISIYLVNGFSKIKYSVRIIKQLFKVGIPISSLGFLIFHMLNVTSLKHFTSIFGSYVFLMMLTFVTLSILTIIFIFSLNEVTAESYLYGYNRRSFSSLMISIFKYILVFIISTSLLGIVNRVKWGNDILFDGKNKANHNMNIYKIQEDSNNLNLLRSSEQIIENLKELDNGIYVNYKIDDIEEYEYEEGNFNRRIIYANNEFIKRQNFFTTNGEELSELEENVIYIQEKNVNLLSENNIKSLYTCSECSLPEINVLSNESKLIPYTDNILSKSSRLKDDFIVINRELDKNSYLMTMLFEFDNEKSINQFKRDLLKDVEDVDIEFTNVGKVFRKEYKITINNIFYVLQWSLAYILILITVSIIYYQVQFDKVKREYTILLANGTNKLSSFYYDLIFNSIVYAIITVIAKNLYYPESSIYYIIPVSIIFLIVDCFVLKLSLNNFFKTAVNSLKERI